MMKTSSVGKTDRVTVRFATGQDTTLPIHGLRQPQTLQIMDELDVKDFSELTGPQLTLQKIRFMTKVSAIALTFPGQENWSVERINDTFADLQQIAKIFTKALELSDLTGSGASKPSIQVQKHGATYG